MTNTGTAGQTVGPFFGFALPYEGSADLVPPGTDDVVQLHGTVFDGAGAPVPDALVELWQRTPAGTVATEPGSLRRGGTTFTGWGRAATDASGRYAFSTVLPGVHVGGGTPFVSMTVFARGLLDRLFTRAYLPRPGVEPVDPLLASLPHDRRATLLAVPDELGYRFDVVLQGAGETVFLSYGDGSTAR